MTAISPEATRRYDLGFARWIFKNLERADRLNMCMQCGACSGSCPLGEQMDYGPRRLFMMVRAGMKEEVLKSNTIWNCVACYNCEVRCPREVPVTHILGSIASLAVKEGVDEAVQSENARFAKAFFWTAEMFGRADERLLTAKFFFSGGIGNGMQRMKANQKTALGMVKTKRMHIGLPHRIKKAGELKKILAKAKEIEAQEIGG